VAAIELNADVGELPGEDGRARDREMLAIVNAANVACGTHAGDEATLAATLRVCAELGVAPAAHPGYPDREGFGRRRGTLTPAGIRDSVRAQLRLFADVAARAGVRAARVKAHGALYNEASVDRAIADALLAAVGDVLPGATLLALAESPFVGWAREEGFSVLREGFADRGYRPDGTLVPRSQPGALIEDARDAAARAVRLAREGRVIAVSGDQVALDIDTLCRHGDSEGAAARARAVHAALERAGVALRAAKT
jgi:UPF0271 protein